MSKLIGKRKREYLADVVRQEPSLDAALADRLTTRLDGAIRSLRTTKQQRAGARMGTGAEAVPGHIEERAANKPFDPYAFNAILTLRRAGRDELRGRLAEINQISHLRQLADAQYIGLDQDMRTGSVDIEDLREAVLRGAERLVADRQAAQR